MSYQSNPPHLNPDAEDESKSNPIPNPNLQLIGIIDTYGLTSNCFSPSFASDSTLASPHPSTPTVSPNQACFNAPLMSHQTPNLFVGPLDSLQSMDTFSIQTSQIIDGQLDLPCFGTFDRLFAPQVSFPPASDASLAYIGSAVGGNLSPGGSHAVQASHSMTLSTVDSEGPITSYRRNGSMARRVGYSVPGNPSDYFNRSGVSPLHQGTTPGPTPGSNFRPRLILPSSASGLSPAQLVDCLRYSPYVTEHRLEPTDYRRRSIFLELLRKTPNLQNHFECIVPCSDGTPCAKIFNRADRGLTHIRTHFDHRPFHCRGRCNTQKCSQKFHSNEGLAAHLKPKFEKCQKCHNKFHRQNIRRHEKRCRGPQ